jgi:ABC-type multidrug transport system fused ATPase/permease subunit
MKQLPVADPGTPDARSASRLLVWLCRVEARTVAGGMALGVLWMVSQAVVPLAVGRAVDALTRHDRTVLLEAVAVITLCGVVQAVTGVMRHRFAVTNYLATAYRVVQLVVRQSTRLGATLSKRVSTGEVVSIGTSDIDAIGDVVDMTARASGAVVSVVMVTGIMLWLSAPLGLVVLCGVPVLLASVVLLLRPLHRRRQAQRALTGALIGRAGDIVAGLRVLRGVGGEAAFAGRYRARSQDVRAAGVRVAKVESVLDAAQILLPGVFVAVVTWLGARLAVGGGLTAGGLVTFYAYAAFMITPLRVLVELFDRLVRGHVAARRVVALLALRPEVTDPADPVPLRDGDLAEPVSGTLVKAGRLTAIAATRPEDAARIADRIGLLDPASTAELAGVPLALAGPTAVRARIVVADNEGRLFRGALRDELGLEAAGADAAVLHCASAEDIVEALPDGLDTVISERGREFSGGQQQRLRLARALARDPAVLVLVEPTSAVDAHTEARIADRLAEARSGRTTVVCTTSPLVLDRVDTVLFVDEGRVAAEGTHRDLLETCAPYAALVRRGTER